MIFVLWLRNACPLIGVETEVTAWWKLLAFAAPNYDIQYVLKSHHYGALTLTETNTDAETDKK